MSYLGQAWNQGMFGWTLGNTLLAPNPPYPNCRMCAWDGDWDCPGMYGLSSFHPGGGNVAFRRRLGPVPQVVDRHADGLGPRVAGPGRGPLGRFLLIRMSFEQS